MSYTYTIKIKSIVYFLSKFFFVKLFINLQKCGIIIYKYCHVMFVDFNIDCVQWHFRSIVNL